MFTRFESELPDSGSTMGERQDFDKLIMDTIVLGNPAEGIFLHLYCEKKDTPGGP